VAGRKRTPQSKRKRPEQRWHIAMLSWKGIGHVIELAKALKQKGNQIHLYTPEGNHSNTVTYKDARNLSDAIAQQILEEYKKGAFDVIHICEWHPCYAGINLRKKYRGRLVYSTHSTEKMRIVGEMDKESEKIYRLERLMAQISDRVIAWNPIAYKKICKDFLIPENKVTLIYDGFGYKDFRGVSDPGAIKKRYDIGPLDPLILFVGELSEANGPDILIKAIPTLLERYPNLHFVFVGDGDLMWSLRIYAHYSYIEYAVRFLGHKEGKELYELFQASDMVVIPSRKVSTPYQILAAWSSEKPVVATYEGSFGLIHHENDGIMVQDNPDSIRWGIEKIVSDWEYGHLIAKNGWRRIRNTFSWSGVAGKVEKVYQSLLENKTVAVIKKTALLSA